MIDDSLAYTVKAFGCFLLKIVPSMLLTDVQSETFQYVKLYYRYNYFMSFDEDLLVLFK